MEGKKESKTTNKTQFESLVAFMQKNADIARGSINSVDKVSYRKKWRELTEKLNSYGPPSRDMKGWEKVWRDYRNNIKKKVSHNKKEQNSTGGGLNKLMHVSVLEETVINLLNLNNIVTEGSKPIGLSSGLNNSEEIEAEIETLLSDIDMVASRVESTEEPKYFHCYI